MDRRFVKSVRGDPVSYWAEHQHKVAATASGSSSAFGRMTERERFFDSEEANACLNSILPKGERRQRGLSVRTVFPERPLRLSGRRQDESPDDLPRLEVAKRLVHCGEGARADRQVGSALAPHKLKELA